MPLYDYKCGGGHEYELTEGFQASTAHPCPTCGKKSRRQISLPAVIFKGSGFYSTDNRKGAGGNGRSGSSSESDSTGNGQSHGDQAAGEGDRGDSQDSPPKVEAAAPD